MKRRGQRRALSAGRDVRRAEVAYDGHAQRLGKVGRLADLQRRGRPGVGIVEDRLSVQARELRPGSAPRWPRLRRIKAPEVVLQLRHLPACRRAPRRRVQPRPQRARKLHTPERAQLQARIRHGTQRVVHAIDAGAGHDAEHVGGLHGSSVARVKKSLNALKR